MKLSLAEQIAEIINTAELGRAMRDHTDRIVPDYYAVETATGSLVWRGFAHCQECAVVHARIATDGRHTMLGVYGPLGFEDERRRDSLESAKLTAGEFNEP